MSKLSVIETAWFNFVTAALLLDFPDHTIVFAQDNGPKVPKPYLTLKITGPARVMQNDPRKYNSDSDTFNFQTHRRYNMSIQSYGVDHTDVLDDIILGSQNPDTKQLLKDCDIGIELRGNITDISGTNSTAWEKRASLDISFLASRIKSTNIGTIESAEISGEITNIDETKIIIDKFTVSKP